MPGPRSPRVVEVTADGRAELVRLRRSPSVPAGLAQRARLVRRAADGIPLEQSARRLDIDSDRGAAVGRPLSRGRPGRPARSPAAGSAAGFPPEVDLHLGRLARQLAREGIVAASARQTVQRRLAEHDRKPWRTHAWLYPRAERDPAFAERTREVAERLTRPLAPAEVVVSRDELTSLQPRPRLAPTRPARPRRPVQVEHEYRRAGAAHLFAAIETRTGRVYAAGFSRRSQHEYLVLLEDLDRALPPAVTTLHLLADNGSIHHGRRVRRWLATHPRFVAPFTPTHCSWMDPIEQWVSILRRKRLRDADFADLSARARAIRQFVREWNERAHPFRWTTKSFTKLLAKLDLDLPTAA